MVERFGGVPTGTESNERMRPAKVNFLKLGGTWDMTFRDGKKIGTGNLDDDALKELQTKAGYFSDDPNEVIAADRNIAIALYHRFQQTKPVRHDVGKHLSDWAHSIKATLSPEDVLHRTEALMRGELSPHDLLEAKISEYISGPFIPLFSGDSSHLESQLTAPLVTTLLQRALQEPNKPLLGGQGTDTADMAMLQLYDAFTFDTKLPPLILTGSNRSHVEKDSDAPRNFLDLSRLANLDVPPGGYWVFQGNLYTASDVIKIDPGEDRRIEEQSTFHSPHRKNIKMADAVNLFKRVDPNTRSAPSQEHITHRISVEKLYDALESIYNPDLGKKDSVPRIVIPGIRNPLNKAVIISAHSLGNTSNGIRNACIKEARGGKLIAGISRTLVSATNEEYASSLFGANTNEAELGKTGKRIIYGHKLNSSVANALMVRALIAKLDQEQTQTLFTTYAIMRDLA